MKSSISLFNYIITKKQSTQLEYILNLMLKDDLINKELYLNFIKALIVIFTLDNNNFSIYYNLFYNIYYKMDKSIQQKICNKIKTIRLSRQLELNDEMIDNIILSTNIYILKNQDNVEQLIINIINILTLIKQLSISLHLKSLLYINIIKQKSCQNISINQVNNIIQNITKMLK